jgi:hypothetical protein
MRLVIVESPFAGDIERNLRYLRACLRDCLKRGEAPYASHAIYTQPGVLDDGDAAERKHGIEAGFEWRKVSEATCVYTDLGVSTGMQYGIDAHVRLAEAEFKNGDTRRAIEYRQLGEDWEAKAIAAEEIFVSKWPAPFDRDAKVALIEGVLDVVIAATDHNIDEWGGSVTCATLLLDAVEAKS